MSDNPLKFDPKREHRIRERAYHLWESEGKPHGRDADYWERARELDAMEASGATGQIENPIAAGIDPTAPVGVEEASIQENLGEFPGLMSDQGEDLQTPMAKHHETSEPAEVPAPAAAAKKPKKKKA
jgi:hypothetical protein